MKKRVGVAIFGACMICGITLAAWADTLELQDGRVIEGKYLGGTQQTIRFQADKKTVVYQVKDVVALTFGALNAPLSQTTPAQPVPGKRPPKELTIAPGTPLPVRLAEAVDISTARPDDMFKALLDADLVIDGVLLAPKGSPVNGRVVKADPKEAVLTVTLRDLLLNQQAIPITTTEYTVSNKARPLLETSSLKIVTRPRELRIAEQSVIEFKTTEAIKLIEVSR